QPIDALLQLDQAPDGECVIVLFGTRALEMKEGGLVLAAIVQQVREIDARLAETRIELERAAQPMQAAAFVREPMRGITHTRRGVGRIRMRAQRALEEAPRLIEHRFAKQRASDLQHQIVIVLEAE